MDSSSAPKSPDSNSGIDFNDVFGGPPRSSSIQKTRYSFGENTNSYSLSSAFRRSDETFAASMNPWSGLSEKPVFGEEGMSRGRVPKNDFFDDIFRGNESLSSSPRKYAMKDPFAPGSLLSSPARLPPMAEPFGSSLPSRFSLPAKLNKGMDLPPFGSLTCTSSKSKDGSSNGLSYYACSPMSRFSGQANQDKEGVKNDFQSSFRFSALSQELSSGSEELISLGMFDETETKGNAVEDFNGAEISKNGSRFHFSMYKWDNKGGGPLAAPLRGSDKLKEKDKLQRCSNANGWIACESMAMESKAELRNNSFSTTDRMSANAKSFRVERDKNETLGSFIDSGNEDGESGRTIKEDNIPNTVSEIGSRIKTTDKNVSADKREKQVSAVGKETKKPQPKTLKLLFHDDDDCEQGNDKMTRNVGTKGISEKSAKKLSEIVDGENMKKQEVKKRATSNNTEAGTTRVKGSPKNSWDNGKGRVKGKVKEFIKIFNQDAPPKPRADTVCEVHSSRRMETHATEPENEPTMTEREEKIHMPKLQKKKSSPDVPVANHLYNNASEKNTNSSATDSVSDGSKTIIGDPADSFEDNFSIEDLTPEEKILPELGIDPEEIKAIDAKIQLWSNGKQGNIRSLLSTLHYVLWPNSGWRPVPLVDIIEGPAVKRSYQKALLCLHPDKLQQKGAATDKKYNAEKVFDVLQDAWTHFNSLGSM